MTSSTSLPYKVCFNSECNNINSEQPRKGWRLRSGQLAILCDSCASAYEEGRFCETFHANDLGWRCCQTCGKRVHCGCIVSVNLFTLLDPGGIECISCARKNVAGLGLSWPSTFFLHAPLTERPEDLPVKNWNHLSGSGPVPWRQAPILFNSSPTDLRQRGSQDGGISIAIDRSNLGDRLQTFSLENKRKDITIDDKLKLGTHESGHAGINSSGYSSSCLNISQQMTFVKESQSKTQLRSLAPYSSINEIDGRVGAFGGHLRSTPPPPFVKHFNGNLHNGLDSSSETQVHDGRSRVDTRGKSQLQPRYWPRFTDQELQHISGDSNSVITPLFEKMLSASDAGRIGRLVLPKKCAEAYFPPILHSEGLPLKVQDATGKEWTFQFRFWPNNNSRMYVLEGITPCIQNMQLQAGDTVTFSRLEPEGKLVMGSRKASAAPLLDSDQVNGTVHSDSGVSTRIDAGLVNRDLRSEVDKSGYTAKEALGAKASRKRKSNTMDSKRKHLRLESEVIELELTWKKTQGVLRPPPNHVPSVVVIEGFEFEEYEDAPILGKPTIFATDCSGEKVQWVQCESCLKWRRLPVSALLPSYWTCSDNSWNPERSSCSASQDLTEEHLEKLLSDNYLGGSKKTKTAKQHAECTKALEGLDTLANLAILGEGESLPTSTQATTKHPRHKPGCSCIVCIQPPSGKGPKHKQSCICILCQSVKRRFRTLMLRREKKQSEKEAETTHKKPKQQQTEKSREDNPYPSSNAGNSFSNKHTNLGGDGCDDDSATKSSDSPFKGHINLNIQPEKNEELSPGSNSGKILRMLQDSDRRFQQQQRLSSVAIQKTSRDEEPSPGSDPGKIMRMLQDAERHFQQQQQRFSSVAIQRTSTNGGLSPGSDSGNIMRTLQDAERRLQQQQQRLSSVAIQITSSDHMDMVKLGERVSNNVGQGSSCQDAEKYNGALPAK